MNFAEYIKFVKPYKEILKGFPQEDDSFILHFGDCNKKIPDFEVFKRCWHKHRESSPFFPSSVELIKLSLPDFPLVSADDILNGKNELGCEVNNYLCEKYGLSLPTRTEISKSLQKDYNGWLQQIRFYLPQLVQDYKDLKTDNSMIFTENVLKELGFNNKQMLIG